jgi:hypothetical protein
VITATRLVLALRFKGDHGWGKIASGGQPHSAFRMHQCLRANIPAILDPCIRMLDTFSRRLNAPDALYDGPGALPGLGPMDQFPKHGTPRTKDGKPGLSAPTPKYPDGRPDLSGIWLSADPGYLDNLAKDLKEVPFQPWAEKAFRERQESNGKGRPSERCISHGVTDFDALATPTKIIQTPDMIVVLFEILEPRKGQMDLKLGRQLTEAGANYRVESSHIALSCESRKRHSLRSDTDSWRQASPHRESRKKSM